MKRFVLFCLILLFSISLFAADKKIYTKKTNLSVLEMYEAKEGNYKFYIATYEQATEDENDACVIYSDNEKKLKDFLVYLINHNLQGLYAPSITYYEVSHNELSKVDSDTRIDSKRNKIEHINIYVLE